jgi:hypothetical protein
VIRRGVAAGLALALGALASAAAADDAAKLRLRYGWTAGQTWHATHSLERELKVAGELQRERGVAHFEYSVRADTEPAVLRLEARMLSQETLAGVSPLDFSAVLFRTRVDAQGRQQGAHYAISEAQPPAISGVQSDPIAYRRMLRQVASAWRHSVFWFPELPERSLAPGEDFVVQEDRDLGGEQPGVSMRIRNTRKYRLLAVESGVARFHVEEVSSVEAAAAESGLASTERAEGEALFDVALGMWKRQQLKALEHSRYADTPDGAGSGEASSTGVTTIEMGPGPAPAPAPR